MIKAVIFDADGVVINGEMFSEHLARDFGITTETTKSFFTGPFHECRIGKADLKEIIKPYLQKWGWKGTVDELLAYWFKSEHSVDEKLVNFIRELRESGIKCYLATNQERYRTEYMLNKIGFAQIFDKIYVSLNLGCVKTSPEFYKKIKEDLQDFKKEEILFWDNDPKHIKVAKDFGILAELYTFFDDFKQKMKNYL
jgi:putative hydrolase of the HAD superfamily